MRRLGHHGFLPTVPCASKIKVISLCCHTAWLSPTPESLATAPSLAQRGLAATATGFRLVGGFLCFTVSAAAFPAVNHWGYTLPWRGLPPPFDSRRPGQGAAETEAFPIPVRMEKESSHLNLCFRAYASTNGAVYRGTCFTLVRFILLHLFMPSSVAAGLKINFCTPAAASRSCLVITPCETRTSRSSRMNLHRQQESYLQPGTRLGGKCSYAVTFGCFLQIVPHYAQQLQLFGY